VDSTEGLNKIRIKGAGQHLNRNSINQILLNRTRDAGEMNTVRTMLLKKKGDAPELSDFSCTIVAHATARPMCVTGRTLSHHAAGRRPL
jgi:hypothetical protein